MGRVPGTASVARRVTAAAINASIIGAALLAFAAAAMVTSGNAAALQSLNFETLLATLRTSDGAQLQDLRYTYDPVGNITYIEDRARPTVFFRNAIVEAHAGYVYDATYRLISAQGREHAGQAVYDQTFIPQAGQLLGPNDANAMRRYRNAVADLL